MDDRLLSDLVSKGTPPDLYVLRKARTLDDILGEDNQFGLKSGSAMSADTVNIFNSATTKLAAYYSGMNGEEGDLRKISAICRCSAMNP